jgi:hypothetical protein
MNHTYPVQTDAHRRAVLVQGADRCRRDYLHPGESPVVGPSGLLVVSLHDLKSITASGVQPCGPPCSWAQAPLTPTDSSGPSGLLTPGITQLGDPDIRRGARPELGTVPSTRFAPVGVRDSLQRPLQRLDNEARLGVGRRREGAWGEARSYTLVLFSIAHHFQSHLPASYRISGDAPASTRYWAAAHALCEAPRITRAHPQLEVLMSCFAL